MGVESQHHRRDRHGDEDHEPRRIGDGERDSEGRHARPAELAKSCLTGETRALG